MSGEWRRVSEAERERIRPYLDQIPVKIAALARDLGLEVKSATLRPRISGQLQRSESSPSGFRIRVNRHEAANRQRFTIAHEVAHFLLHRDQVGDGIEDSILYRSSLSDAREAEANRLAAMLLMPELMVRKILRDHGGVVTPRIVSLMADQFGVSEAAMGIRLGQ